MSSGDSPKDALTVGLSGFGSEPTGTPEALNGSLPPVDPFELAEWDIVTFVDPRDSSVYEIIDGRVIIALQNPPILPEVDPNYFDIERDATDPVYSQVVYYYTITTGLDGLQTMTSDTAVAAFLAAENVTVYSEWPEVGGIAVTLPEGQTVADAVANWPAEYPALIEAVDPDSILESCTYPYTQPNDEGLHDQGYLRTSATSYQGIPTEIYAANVFSAWQQGELGTPNRVVAIIDTGVCSQTADLSTTSTTLGVNTGDKRSSTEYTLRSQGGGEPWDWLMNRSQAYASGLGHGTCVAGAISAIHNNDTLGTEEDDHDIAGVAPGCRYLPIAAKAKGISDGTNFGAKFSMSALLNAMSAVGTIKGLPAYRTASIYGSTSVEYINIEVCNNSWGIRGSGSRSGTRHLKYLGRYILFIAAAGNDDNNTDYYWPACHSSVTAVAAHILYDGRKWSDSNYQSYVQVSAPGFYMLTTDMKGSTSNGYDRGYSEGDITYVSGTSFSASIASGAAMLITSKWPSLWPSMVRTQLISSSGTSPDPDLSHVGYIDVYQALNP